MEAVLAEGSLQSEVRLARMFYGRCVFVLGLGFSNGVQLLGSTTNPPLNLPPLQWGETWPAYGRVEIHPPSPGPSPHLYDDLPPILWTQGLSNMIGTEGG